MVGCGVRHKAAQRTLAGARESMLGARLTSAGTA
jgi:hypothetical protein